MRFLVLKCRHKFEQKENTNIQPHFQQNDYFTYLVIYFIDLSQAVSCPPNITEEIGMHHQVLSVG